MEIIKLLKTPARNSEQRILKIFLIVVLPVMAILTVIAIADYKTAKSEIIAKMVRDQSANANKRITNFLDPIIRDTLFFQDQGNQGKLNPEKPAEVQEMLNGFSKFYLQDVKQVLFYDGTDVSAYQLVHADSPEPTKHSGPLYELDKTLAEDYQANQVRWASGDFDPVKGESTLLAETLFSNPETNKSYSMALHIESTAFFEGLEKHMTGPQRLVLLRDINNDLRTMLFDYAKDGKPEIRELSDGDLPEADVAISLLQNDKTKETVPFTFEGKIWWASILKLQDRKGDLYSALIVPESAVMAGVQGGRLTLPMYSSIVTAVALFATIFLWRRYEQEVKQAMLPPVLNEMDEQLLLETINSGEGDHMEFKSTLRWNLKANKQSKDMELACMKTLVAFMNSSGGSLVVGVEDDGNILGTEADNFPNEDKLLLHFNNLIKQHIGLAFSKFILFKARTIDDKIIIVADCQKSDLPVFLKKKAGEEEFYIRVGPGSRNLSLSETMNYLNNN